MATNTAKTHLHEENFLQKNHLETGRRSLIQPKLQERSPHNQWDQKKKNRPISLIIVDVKIANTTKSNSAECLKDYTP